jgi:alcohol dehydrogenase class IV
MSWTTWSFPTRIHFGAGALESLAPALRDGLGSRALVVTDPGMIGTDPLEALLLHLEDADIPCAVFSGISPNPSAPDVVQGVAAWRELGGDCLIGIGGGSAMDGAKAIQLMATHPGRIEDYDERRGGYERITDNVPPLITLPTTAGTGSEVGRSTVIVDPAIAEKMVIFHPALMPALAIVDPALMTSLPPHITAATGLDALTHNIEAHLSRGVHPMADGIALEGIRLVARSLERAVNDGQDIAARSDMAAAALMGAVAFQKGLGVTHSLAHPLSTLAGLHHGLANGILLPTTMAFNGARAPERFPALANAAGQTQHGGDPQAAVEIFVAWIRRLNEAVGIPANLRAAGVTEDLVPALSDQAFTDGCHAGNPVEVSRDDMEMLYREAF